MDDNGQLRGEIEALKNIVSDLEEKANDLYARPLMPYSSGGAAGYILRLGSDNRPYWSVS
jgi:hypothetical protein